MVLLIKTPDTKLQEINRTTNRIIWHDFAVLKMIHRDILWPIYIGNIDIRCKDKKNTKHDEVFTNLWDEKPCKRLHLFSGY